MSVPSKYSSWLWDMCYVRCLSLKSVLLYIQMSLSLKVQVQSDSFELGPGVGRSECRSPLRATPQITAVLWVLWTRGPLVFKGICFRLLSQLQVLKFGVTHVEFKPFPPQEKALSLELSWLWVTMPRVRFMVRLCFPATPTHFNVVFLSFTLCGHCSASL